MNNLISDYLSKNAVIKDDSDVQSVLNQTNVSGWDFLKVRASESSNTSGSAAGESIGVQKDGFVFGNTQLLDILEIVAAGTGGGIQTNQDKMKSVVYREVLEPFVNTGNASLSPVNVMAMIYCTHRINQLEHSDSKNAEEISGEFVQLDFATTDSQLTVRFTPSSSSLVTVSSVGSSSNEIGKTEESNHAPITGKITFNEYETKTNDKFRPRVDTIGDKFSSIKYNPSSKIQTPANEEIKNIFLSNTMALFNTTADNPVHTSYMQLTPTRAWESGVPTGTHEMTFQVYQSATDHYRNAFTKTNPYLMGTNVKSARSGKETKMEQDLNEILFRWVCSIYSEIDANAQTQTANEPTNIEDIVQKKTLIVPLEAPFARITLKFDIRYAFLSDQLYVMEKGGANLKNKYHSAPFSDMRVSVAVEPINYAPPQILRTGNVFASNTGNVCYSLKYINRNPLTVVSDRFITYNSVGDGWDEYDQAFAADSTYVQTLHATFGPDNVVRVNKIVGRENAGQAPSNFPECCTKIAGYSWDEHYKDLEPTVEDMGYNLATIANGEGLNDGDLRAWLYSQGKYSFEGVLATTINEVPEDKNLRINFKSLQEKIQEMKLNGYLRFIRSGAGETERANYHIKAHSYGNYDKRDCQPCTWATFDAKNIELQENNNCTNENLFSNNPVSVSTLQVIRLTEGDDDMSYESVKKRVTVYITDTYPDYSSGSRLLELVRRVMNIKPLDSINMNTIDTMYTEYVNDLKTLEKDFETSERFNNCNDGGLYCKTVCDKDPKCAYWSIQQYNIPRCKILPDQYGNDNPIVDNCHLKCDETEDNYVARWVSEVGNSSVCGIDGGVYLDVNERSRESKTKKVPISGGYPTISDYEFGMSCERKSRVWGEDGLTTPPYIVAASIGKGDHHYAAAWTARTNYYSEFLDQMTKFMGMPNFVQWKNPDHDAGTSFFATYNVNTPAKSDTLKGWHRVCNNCLVQDGCDTVYLSGTNSNTKRTLEQAQARGENTIENRNYTPIVGILKSVADPLPQLYEYIGPISADFGSYKILESQTINVSTGTNCEIKPTNESKWMGSSVERYAYVVNPDTVVCEIPDWFNVAPLTFNTNKKYFVHHTGIGPLDLNVDGRGLQGRINTIQEFVESLLNPDGDDAMQTKLDSLPLYMNGCDVFVAMLSYNLRFIWLLHVGQAASGCNFQVYTGNFFVDRWALVHNYLHYPNISNLMQNSERNDSIMNEIATQHLKMCSEFTLAYSDGMEKNEQTGTCSNTGTVPHILDAVSGDSENIFRVGGRYLDPSCYLHYWTDCTNPSFERSGILDVCNRSKASWNGIISADTTPNKGWVLTPDMIMTLQTTAVQKDSFATTNTRGNNEILYSQFSGVNGSENATKFSKLIDSQSHNMNTCSQYFKFNNNTSSIVDNNTTDWYAQNFCNQDANSGGSQKYNNMSTYLTRSWDSFNINTVQVCSNFFNKGILVQGNSAVNVSCENVANINSNTTGTDVNNEPSTEDNEPNTEENGPNTNVNSEPSTEDKAFPVMPIIIASVAAVAVLVIIAIIVGVYFKINNIKV